MRHAYTQIKKLRSIPLFYYIFVVGIFSVLFLNTIHFYYPDEFDNISGGWFLLKGIPIYKGFFTHHGPVAYFLSALILLFSGQSFVWFRYIYTFFVAAFIFGGYLLLRHKMTREDKRGHIVFIGLLAVSATYFWGQMILADVLAAYFLIPVYGLVLYTILNARRLRYRDLAVASGLISLSLLSSLSYLYLGLIIYAVLLYLYFKSSFIRFTHISTFFPLIIFAAPYVIFLLYLLGTNSFNDYYFQNIQFNRASYVYNYPRPAGSTSINPIRFAIVIAHDFVQNYHGLITQINRFDLFYPVNLTFAVSNIALVIYAMYKRKYILALFIIGFMIYSNVRSNPLDSKETDYQAAVYIVMSLFNGVFVVRKLHEDINSKTEQLATKVVFSTLLVGTGLLVLFTSYYMFRKFFDKSYEKYMGTASTIYDRPQFAPIINAVVNENDYMWIGPFEFEELFYANGKFPSKYHILIPGMRQQPAVIQQVMSDFERNKPKVIYFNRQYHVLGMEPSQYAPWFLSFLDSNYVTLVNYREGGYQYKSVKGIDLSYDPEAKLYINKDNLREVIDKLLGANIIKKVEI